MDIPGARASRNPVPRKWLVRANHICDNELLRCAAGRRRTGVADPNVTQILDQVRAGNDSAAERLLPLVYDELRALAQSFLARERPGHTCC